MWQRTTSTYSRSRAAKSRAAALSFGSMRSSDLLEAVQLAAAPLVLADHLLEGLVLVGHPAAVAAGVQQVLFLGVVEAVGEVPEEAEDVAGEVGAHRARGLDVGALLVGGVGDLQHQAVLGLQDLPPAHGSSFHELCGSQMDLRLLSQRMYPSGVSEVRSGAHKWGVHLMDGVGAARVTRARRPGAARRAGGRELRLPERPS